MFKSFRPLIVMTD